jgi:anti-sigma regulatory factor (Ser/Thr protein kinase)
MQLNIWYKKRQEAILKSQKRRAGRKKFLKLTRQHSKKVEKLSARARIKKKVYNPQKLLIKKQTVKFVGHFGIEDDLEKFIDICTQFMTVNMRELNFDFSECERLWPSGLTVLCSLSNWVTISYDHSSKKRIPIIRSSTPKSTKVELYLQHSGFYDYVKRGFDVNPTESFPGNSIVKIRREIKNESFAIREDEIIEHLEECSDFSEDQIEEFNDIVLTEVFNNISEHAIAIKDMGWWSLSQVHKKRGIISLCIADNGIGIKNNLLTGPQRDELLKDLSENGKNDGFFIEKALQENISGAVKASVRTDSVPGIKKYDRGARRGHGLKRVTKACKNLGIKMIVLSQKGCVAMNNNGIIIKNESRDKTIFAGTMYHFTIQAKSKHQ